MAVLTVNLNDDLHCAAEIPALQHAEAPALALTEFERTLSVLESLDGDDWEQPTYCTDWNVLEMTAHLAGAVAGYASWGEFIHQSVMNPYMRSEEKPVDGINRRHLEDREGRPPADLIQEFREAAPKAIRIRHNIPWPLHSAPLLRGEPVSDTSFRYLLDVIYPRDWWMHRYDICAATGVEMVVDPAHDGRIVDLIVRDVAYVLAQHGTEERSLVIELEGAAGGTYRIGPDLNPNTVIRIDTFDFALVSSGRITLQEALARATVHGDRATTEWFLKNCEVLY